MEGVPAFNCLLMMGLAADVLPSTFGEGVPSGPCGGVS